MHTNQYMKEVSQIIEKLDLSIIDNLTNELLKVRTSNGRLFILGVGGSAGNASHAVNDFRKLCGIETYTPTDNISELSARINDEGWDTSFSNWLKASNIKKNDALLVFSVGGGDIEKNVSVNIVNACKTAKSKDMKVFGIVGPNGGFTFEVGDCVVKVPLVNHDRITPHSEAFQSIIWHCLVSNPLLQINNTKW
jgi:D-sedoheptulose 7-phosphate isomerase